MNSTPNPDTQYALNDAAEITGNTVASLRTRIARNLLRHVGNRPLAGAERRFSIGGMYEIALIDELERNGLTQSDASRVVDFFIHRQILNGALNYWPGKDGFFTPDEVAHLEALPQFWVKGGALDSGDSAAPNLLAFVIRKGQYFTPTATAKGWAELSQAIETLLTFEPTPSVVHVVNVSDVVDQVNRKIAEWVKAIRAEQEPSQ